MSTLRLVVLILVAAALAGVLVWQQQNHNTKNTKIYNPKVLAAFDGSRGSRMYLSILGEVYDVSLGAKYYSQGKGYHHFVGRDGTRAFVTGEFEKDCTDNVTDFGVDECAGLIHWRGFYRNHTEYKYKGRLVGVFYDGGGQPTEELARVERLAAQAKSTEQKMRELEAQFPRCNSRWNQEDGGYVWCEDGMYPRKLTLHYSGQKGTVRCACFKELGWSDIRQVYAGCEAEAHECQVTPPGPSPKIPQGFIPQTDVETVSDQDTSSTEAKLEL